LPDQIPAVLPLEMTRQFYEARKEFELQKVPAIARPLINIYFEWLAHLKPSDVIDGIEQNLSVQDARKKASFPLRASIATAKAFLSTNKTYQAKLREIATPELAFMTLKYENPDTYQVIMSYGERGTTFLNTWIAGVIVMLGAGQPV
jgi:hypothetical protein